MANAGGSGKGPDRQPEPGKSGRRFEKSVVVITGANDRGFGGAIAERFAEEGANLVLIDIVKPVRLKKRLRQWNSNFRWHQADVTNTEAINAATAETVAEFGRIDVVVNSAGISQFAPFEQLGDDDWDRTFDVNVKGAVRMTRAALPHMTAPGGAIVNIASYLGVNACEGNALYGASKAALVALTNSLAVELAPRGIRAVCVAPALANTPMLHQFSNNFTPQAWEQVKSVQPLGLGSRYNIADAVLFLASSEANWITGATLPLGWTHAVPLPAESLYSSSA